MTTGRRAGIVDGMDLCKRQHDKDLTGRRTDGGCAECHREQRRRARQGERLPCVHPGPCQPVRSSNGRSYCAVQRRLSGREPAAVKAARAALKRDGWESEFGAIEPMPDGYVDWVAEAREGRFEPRERVSAPLRSSVEGRIGSSHSSGKRPAYRGLRAGA